MMNINITKNDILWSYLAQFLMLGTGLVTLPIILKFLSAEEIGFYYLLLSINSVVTLFDMGFSSQFGRNITYVLSGAQSLKKEGLSLEYGESINEKLLAKTLVAAKKIYNYIAWIALIPLLTFGTIYVYIITDSFTSIDFILPIWVIFCISCFFNLHYMYLNSFLQGRGLIKDTKKGQVISKIMQIIITFSALLCGFGLLSVVVANLIAPFIFRFYTYKRFHDAYINKILNENTVSSCDIKHVFKVLFYNAKKLGVIGILSTALGYASTLIVGAYLPLADVGSYGLMVQLVGIIGTVSTVFFNSITPQLGNLMVRQEMDNLREKFGVSVAVFIIIQALGLIVLLGCPTLFKYCGFSTQLPSFIILVLYWGYKFLEQIQGLYSQLLLIENDMVFYPSAILTGVISVLFLFIMLNLNQGIIGIVIAQSIPLYIYAAWKWPLYVSKKYEILFRTHIVSYPFNYIYQVIRARLKFGDIVDMFK